jgi:hypothetical protein
VLHSIAHPVHQSIDAFRREHRLECAAAPFPRRPVGQDRTAKEAAQRAPEHALPDESPVVVAENVVHVIGLGYQIGPEQAQVEPDDLAAGFVGERLERPEGVTCELGEGAMDRDAACFTGAHGIDVGRHGGDPLNPRT